MKKKVIILAGGKGTRMQSDIPKTLHRLSEKAMISHIILSVLPVDPRPTIVVGHKGEEVVLETDEKFSYVWQKEQLGTGHAVACAKEKLLQDQKEGLAEYILVVPGDAPLIKTQTLERLLEECASTGAALSLAVAVVPDFTGVSAGFERGGRILRNDAGDVRGIIEWKDASGEEREIREINAGFYCFRADFLWNNIEKLESANAAKEIYLTDIVALAAAVGEKIRAVVLDDPLEGLGVNTQEELAAAEQIFRVSS
ncbi:MAG: NTP transferase domain-containing protein [Parcubacteria group bacterium]|nr:NTP transferase domain-containing protein [Parcubacteria group bacterium]